MDFIGPVLAVGGVITFLGLIGVGMSFTAPFYGDDEFKRVASFITLFGFLWPLIMVVAIAYAFYTAFRTFVPKKVASTGRDS